MYRGNFFTEYRVPSIKVGFFRVPSIYSYYYCARRMG